MEEEEEEEPEGLLPHREINRRSDSNMHFNAGKISRQSSRKIHFKENQVRRRSEISVHFKESQIHRKSDSSLHVKEGLSQRSDSSKYNYNRRRKSEGASIYGSFSRRNNVAPRKRSIISLNTVTQSPPREEEKKEGEEGGEEGENGERRMPVVAERMPIILVEQASLEKKKSSERTVEVEMTAIAPQPHTRKKIPVYV